MDGFEAGLRRVARAASHCPIEGEPRLVERIRAEIAATGPLTFARFMELALYEPELGYYRTPTERPGRSGDFLTAPETHPDLRGGARPPARRGPAAARLAGPVRRPRVRRRVGDARADDPPGDRRRGRLGEVAASADLARAIRYAPVEINPYRRAELVERLANAGFGGALELDLAPGDAAPGAVVANEFLDALPVHRVVGRAGGVRELRVDWAGDRFVEVEADPVDPGARGAAGGRGGRARRRPGRRSASRSTAGWTRSRPASERGLVVVIDYGRRATELYGRQRPAAR